VLEARVAALISGGGTNLQALIDAEARGDLKPAKLALAVSSHKAAYGLERAAARGIPAAVISKHMFPDNAQRDGALLNLLIKSDIHMLALGGYLGILGERVLGRYDGRIVNIHPSLIPSFCGKGFYGIKAHEAALARGVKVTGATAHLVVKGIDEGPILMQKAIDVLDGDTPESLQRRVMEEAEWEILPKAVAMFCREGDVANKKEQQLDTA
jgi:phosphoribosylglycinamide formyltransferase-1